MPKFSDMEKEIIYTRLRSEGEKLFTLHGIKKVTVDDLVQAAGIAKGSFYSFYESKEHLFMDINVKIQFKMWGRMNAVLDEYKKLPPKELTKKLFVTMAVFAEVYPIINMLNQDTVEYLMRKLSPEIVAQHVEEDSDFLKKLEEYGVRFKCDRNLAAKVLEHVFLCSVNLKAETLESQRAIMNILLNGAIDQIVKDEE